MGLKYNIATLKGALTILREGIAVRGNLAIKDKNWLSKINVVSDLRSFSASQPIPELKAEIDLFLSALKEIEGKFKLGYLVSGDIGLEEIDEIGRGTTSGTKDLIDLQNMAFIIVAEVFQKNFVGSIDKTSSIHDMWDVVIKLSDVLHHLVSLDKMEILQMIGHHEEQFLQDGASSALYRAFEDWAALRPEEASGLLDRLKQVSSELPLSFLPRIISGLGKVKSNQEVFELVYRDITTLANVLDRYLLIGLSELGYTVDSDNQAIVAFMESIVLKSGIHDEPSIIRIWFNLKAISPKAKEELKKIAERTDDPISKHTFISVLWIKDIYKTDFDFAKEVLSILKPIDPESAGTIRRMSYLFDNLLEMDSDFAVALCLKWLSNPEWKKPQGEEFQRSIRNMSKSCPQALNNFVFYGLMNGPQPVQVHILNIFTKSNLQKGYRPNFPVAKLKTCNEAELELLIRRTIGFVYDKDVLRHLLLSPIHLEELSKEMRQFIKGLFLQYVCFNYTSTIEWFKQPFIQNNEALKGFCEEVSQAYDEYLNGIYKLSVLKEFEPSHERMALFNKLMTSRTEKARKESESHSFLSSVTSIKLKGANKWVIKTNGKLGEISSLSKIEVSSEFPRGECIDPIAMERIRISNKIFIHETDT